MKYLLLVLLVIPLAGCTSGVPGVEVVGLDNEPDSRIDTIYSSGGDEIHRFRDGDIKCYIYTGSYRGGLSCLRDATGSGEAR